MTDGTYITPDFDASCVAQRENVLHKALQKLKDFYADSKPMISKKKGCTDSSKQPVCGKITRTANEWICWWFGLK